MEDEHAQLNLIPEYMKRYSGSYIGYSDHSRGIHVPYAAALMGAAFIEKHITLDRTAFGSDQAASLEPKGLFEMVRNIRSIGTMKGSSVKKLEEYEMPAYKRLVG